MNAVTRHMTWQILVVAVVASAILCTAVVLQQSVRFIDLIVNRGLPASDLIYLSFLITPRFLAIVLPIAVFGATLFTYHRMQIGNELVVLRSAGQNSLGLSSPGLIAGGVCCVVSFAFSLYLMPLSAQNLRTYLNDARSEIGSVLIKEGEFNAIHDDLTVYARQRAENGDLIGLIIHSQQEDGDDITVVAERGAVIDSPGGARILLADGNQQTLSDGELHSVEFEEYVFDLVENKPEEGSYWVKPKERFLHDLLFPSDSAGDVAYRGKLLAEGHNRLAQPLLAMAYVVVALAFLLKSQFSRRSNAKPMFLAIGSVVAMLVTNLGLVSAASKNLSLIPLLYASALVPLIIGLIVLAKPKTIRRGTAPDFA